MPRRKAVIPRKRKTGKRRPRRKAKSLRNRLSGFRWRYLVSGLLVLSLLYIGYLDYTIRSQFEGKRWALPAKVYARAMEIYPGLRLSQQRFKQELKFLGYRYSYDSHDAATYEQQGSHLRFTTRAFNFWDGYEPSRTVEAVFDADVIQQLQDASSGEELSLLRLEPPVIGGIYPAHHEDRVLVKLDEVPPLLTKTLVAVEDRSFYQHHGVNPRAIARALLANIRAGRTVQGGSTLTQQLVKNYFLTNKRSLWRKANEALMALLLELHYDKDEILQAYLNEIYLGQDNDRAIHGFGLAAHFYFDKPLARLNTAQLATLVALVRGPSYYDAWRHPKRLKKRRDLMLEIMQRDKLISREEMRRARQQDLGVVHGKPGAISKYPAFMDLLRRQLQEEYRKEDLTSEGLQIFTTLDPFVQKQAEDALSERVNTLDRQRGLNGKLQGAVVVTSTTGGEVLALVSDRNARYAGFNRALDAVRPIGSLVKPAVYYTALDRPQQFTLATLIEDTPITLQAQNGTRWSPGNYDGESHGRVPLFKALVSSYNQATVRLGMTLGFEPIVDTLHRMGAKRDIPPYPSMLLGAVDFTPFEIAGMYQTLASGGFRSPLRVIREVLTVDGEPLRRYPLNVEQTLNVDTVQVLLSAMMEVTRSGTARSLQSVLPPQMQVAGKTGTTDDLRDSWFAGFSGSHLGVVWLGIDDNKPTGLTGASGALKVWGDVFRHLDGTPLEPLPNDHIEYHWIDTATGLISQQGCPGAVYLAFIQGTAPEKKIECAGGGVRERIDSTVDWFKGLFN